MRKIAGIAGVILLLFLFSPWLMGIFCEHRYPSLITFYADKMSIQVQTYHRGWFSSDAKIRVNLFPPESQSWLGLLPSKLFSHYEISQHIVHGPFFFNKEAPYFIGIAQITNTFSNVSDLNPQASVFITLRGNFFQQISLEKIKINLANASKYITIEKAKSSSWFSPNQNGFSANLQLSDFQFKKDVMFLEIPQLTVTFQQKDMSSQFWLSENTIAIPELKAGTLNESQVEILGVNIKGFFKKVAESLAGEREFAIEQIKIDNNTLGPLYFKLNIANLNAKAVEDLISAYYFIKQRGELYQNQLRNKMLMLLPAIISPNSSLWVDKLSFKTPEGSLLLQGKLTWPANKNIGLPETMRDFFQGVTAKINFTVSKTLLKDALKFAVEMPMFTPPTPEISKKYLKAQQEIVAMKQLNSFLINALVLEQALPMSEALVLLDLQQNNATIEQYQNYVIKLLLQKSISRETSYRLFMQFNEIDRPFRDILAEIKNNQDNNLEALNTQINQWVKEGYIDVKQNNYVVSISQEEGY